ncbi:MAG: hypothetical protein C0183_17365 [Roseiflexus castenholzii]|nr:MAG: hypothetical protein C0183_17365 [Roseiflexus castenholzii]
MRKGCDRGKARGEGQGVRGEGQEARGERREVIPMTIEDAACWSFRAQRLVLPSPSLRSG